MLRVATVRGIHTRSGGAFLRRVVPVKPRRLAFFRPGAVLLYCGRVRGLCMTLVGPIIATPERPRCGGRATETAASADFLGAWLPPPPIIEQGAWRRC